MTIITQKTVFYVGHIEQVPLHFCFVSQGCFVFGNDAQRHANKGAQRGRTPSSLSSKQALTTIHFPLEEEIVRVEENQLR